MTAESLIFQGGSAPRRKGMVALPRARVDLAPAGDGRWMWGVSYHGPEWGFGYGPAVKWGKFADTRAAALAAGVTELLGALRNPAQGKPPREVIAWLLSLQARPVPAQLDLFNLEPQT